MDFIILALIALGVFDIASNVLNVFTSERYAKFSVPRKIFGVVTGVGLTLLIAGGIGTLVMYLGGLI